MRRVGRRVTGRHHQIVPAVGSPVDRPSHFSDTWRDRSLTRPFHTAGMARGAHCPIEASLGGDRDGRGAHPRHRGRTGHGRLRGCVHGRAREHRRTALRPGWRTDPPRRRAAREADRGRPPGGRLNPHLPPLRPAFVARPRRAPVGRAPRRLGLGHPVRAEHGLRRPCGGERIHRGLPGRDADRVRTRPAGLERRGVLWVGGDEPEQRGRRRLHQRPDRTPRVDLSHRPAPRLRHGALQRCAPRVRVGVPAVPRGRRNRGPGRRADGTELPSGSSGVRHGDPR